MLITKLLLLYQLSKISICKILLIDNQLLLSVFTLRCVIQVFTAAIVDNVGLLRWVFWTFLGGDITAKWKIHLKPTSYSLVHRAVGKALRYMGIPLNALVGVSSDEKIWSVPFVNWWHAQGYYVLRLRTWEQGQETYGRGSIGVWWHCMWVDR